MTEGTENIPALDMTPNPNKYWLDEIYNTISKILLDQ